MRIAYFLTHPIQYQSPLIRRLVAEGIELHVYYSTDNTSRSYFDPGYDRKVSWDVPLLDGYPHTVLNRDLIEGSRSEQVARFKTQIEQATQHRPADAFWLHGWSTPFVVAAWKVARERGCPILLRGETSLHSIRGGFVGRFLHRAYYRRAFREVALFLAMGTLNRRLYQRYGVDESQIFLMPHAVDNRFFQNRVAEAAPGREKLREVLGVPADAAVILFCGRLAVEKDIGTLIHSVARLAQTSARKIALLLVGDGPLKSSLVSLADRIAPGVVHFLGFRNQTELPALYDLCDVFVLPSVFETWGLVVNEVMNAGKPVIVSDRVGSGADLVRAGVNGDIFRAGDVGDLTEKLRPWAGEASRCQQAGRVSLDLIDQWSLDEDVAVFQSAVNSLSAGHVRKPRVAFVFTHEIQYFTNVLDELHQRGSIDLLGIYARHTKTMLDTGFNRVIDWDNRSTARFPSVVLEEPASGSKPASTSTWRWNVFRELSRYNPDVVHLNGYSAAIQWQAWLWAVMHRKPIIIRGDGDAFGGPSRSGGTRKGLLLARIFTSKARHVFFQGDENKTFWNQRGARPESSSWIPCVPDNLVYRKNEFATAADRQRFRAEAGAGDQDTVFLVSGKLDPRKRPQDAVEVLSKLKDVSCRIWFLGSGPLEDSLKKLAAELGVAERVHGWGFRNQTEIPRILQAADVLLHPSQQDPWPYSVLEGAMSGLALLLSDQTGSHPDLIAAAGAGLTFKCGDLEDMSRVMRRLATDAGGRALFRAAAQAASLQYTETRFCEIMEAALRKITPPL